MRVFGSEMMSYVAVLGVAAGVVCSIPPESIDFRATVRPSESSANCSFVELTVQEEAAFLRQAKDTWRKGGGSRIYADLVFAELPSEEAKPVLADAVRPSAVAPSLVKGDRTPFLPSLRAAEPERIRPLPPEDGRAFSREELLKLD